MKLEDVIPRIHEPATLVCRALSEKGAKRYRVPVEHRRLERLTAGSRKLLRALPANEFFDQLRCILKDGALGLFAPKLRRLVKPPNSRGQASWGAILVLPPTDWVLANQELAGWQFGGVDSAFKGLPYKLEEVRVFASLNFSPDCWFLVVSGPMAGKVFFWRHDGECDLRRPWAKDVRAWAKRVWDEVPQVFGGIVRFKARDCADSVPRGVELFPEALKRHS